MNKIAELAASLAALEQRVAALEAKGGRKVIAAPRKEENVRILVGREATGEPNMVLPSDSEMRRLRAIVDSAFPRLAFKPRNERYAEADAAEDHRGFVAAFAFLAEQNRTDRLDTKKATSWHVDGVNNWLRDAGKSANVNGRSFIAALVAHGDIPYTAPDDYPVFGLTIGFGRPYSQQWRAVLTTGRVLQPVAKPGPRPATPSPSQLLIVGGEYAA